MCVWVGGAGGGGGGIHIQMLKCVHGPCVGYLVSGGPCVGYLVSGGPCQCRLFSVR